MFVHTDNDLPADPSYPSTSFETLGYEVNNQGQIVNIKPPHEHFPFYVTDNERANQVHKESMHICARKVVAKEVERLGVKELYLYGKLGELMSLEKPEGVPFTRIAITTPDVLKTKRDVVVVIGEQSQDVGIWAYRSLLRDAGINVASAVGLVKKLATLDFNELPEQRAEIVASGPTLHLSGGCSDCPGLILLNPGQRLYSPQLHEIMTQATWQARRRSNALVPAYAIHEDFNYVPGHSTANEHTATFFEYVLPKLIDLASTRIWIVGISDGGEHFVDCLSTLDISTPNSIALHKSIRGMAFLEPQFDASRMRFPPTVLDNLSVAWVKSGTQAKGEAVLGDGDAEKGLKGADRGFTGMRTFSAGVDVDELIWPAVMDDVLEFFERKALDDNKRRAMLAVAEKMKV